MIDFEYIYIYIYLYLYMYSLFLLCLCCCCNISYSNRTDSSILEQSDVPALKGVAHRMRSAMPRRAMSLKFEHVVFYE